MINLLNRLTLGFLFWALVACASLQGSNRPSAYEQVITKMPTQMVNESIQLTPLSYLFIDEDKTIIYYNKKLKQALFYVKIQNISDLPCVVSSLSMRVYFEGKYGKATNELSYFAIKPKETIEKSFKINNLNESPAKSMIRPEYLEVHLYPRSAVLEGYLPLYCFRAYEHWRSLSMGLMVLLGSCLLFRYRVTIIARLKPRLKDIKKKK